ncbi:hypothetical protein GL177_00020 [Vibrio toranzoniae]|uniref:hypothetical protein n=1 Tax=Vibrio toranzoniae TaxID=1194427 RepID=UPI0013787369|nr:hypothetical protein [Vibrio toranzoniae]NAZ51755.1 hypothetical protein [Vibrio toranzoniae]
MFYVLTIHLFVFQSHELSGGTMLEVFAVSESLTGSNIVASSLVRFLCLGGSFANKLLGHTWLSGWSNESFAS